MNNNIENRINSTCKFNPEDERIFCPNVNKVGETGHGLLKKYYIPHLGVNICEYCEIEEDGERRNLSYYQSRKLSKHLISELQNWREEILKFQNINDEVNVKNLVQSLQENNKHLDTSENSLNRCRQEINSLKSLLEDKLLAYFTFLEEILLIKDLIDECKFDANGKLNLIGIGTDSTREAKYIWMSLLFSNMKRQHLNPESFGLTEEMQKSIRNFLDLYITVNSDCTGFVRNVCYNLLPEVARLENKQITINCEDLIRRMPTTNTGVDLSIVNQLKMRIAELEHLNNQKDSVIYELKSSNSNLVEKLNANNDEIRQLQIRIEELLRLSNQKDPEITNLTIVINQINEENSRNKLRIIELENIINQERRENELKLAELSPVIEKLRSDYREVKISHENLFLANKELEALLLAERERANGYKQTIEDLQSKYAELVRIRDNIIIELHTEKNKQGTLTALEQEVVRLRKALADKDAQNGDFNIRYYQMLSDYDYLKQSNESLKAQLEGHLSNYNLLTVINQGLAKRQSVMGEANIVATPMRNLPIVEVQNTATNQTNTVKLDNLNRSGYEGFELVSAGAPGKRENEKPKSLYESQIFVANDLSIPRPSVAANNVFFIPSNINTTGAATTTTYTNTYSNLNTYNIPQQVTQIPSFPIKNQVNYFASYEVEKYPKDIDFITVNPKNLLLSYSALHRIGDWINSQNTLYNIFKVNLLYKSSNEGFSAEKFKANCSGITDTVVLALTNTGKIIGGYTPLSWQSGRNVGEVDSSKKTFIFCLDDGKMFPLTDGAVAITNRENSGPVFGQGEIEILNSAAVEQSINPAFGSSFETYGVTAEQFYGGSSFSIKEYEVYQIYPSTF